MTSENGTTKCEQPNFVDLEAIAGADSDVPTVISVEIASNKNAEVNHVQGECVFISSFDHGSIRNMIIGESNRAEFTRQLSYIIVSLADIISGFDKMEEEASTDAAAAPDVEPSFDV